MKLSRYRKAKGFSNIKSSRLSRKQKKDLESAFENIIDKLSSSKKSKISKTMSKIQAITRGKQTRKRFPEYKIKILEQQQKKLKESIGPKYFKTLQEIPPTLLNKLLNKILEQYEISDNEVKELLIISIISSNVSNNFNNSIENLFELKKTILKYCQQLSTYVGQINSYGIYPSSADEEEREFINDEFRDVIYRIREKMRDLSVDFNKFLIFRERILRELNKILKIVTSESKDSKIIHDFIKEIDIDWYEEIDKAESYRTNSTYKLDLKIENLRKELPKNIENVKQSFERLIKNKLIYTKDEMSRLFDIIAPIYNSITSIDSTYLEFTELMESKKKSRSRVKTSSRRR